MCAFVSVNENRHGNWIPSLKEKEFIESGGNFQYPGTMKSYCKTLSKCPIIDPSSIPSATPSTLPSFMPSDVPSHVPSDVPSDSLPRTCSFDFPDVGTEEFVHGLCVLGASSAKASSNSPVLTYIGGSGPEFIFRNDIILWGDRDYVAQQVYGKGDELCEGGLYLQPSKVKVS